MAHPRVHGSTKIFRAAMACFPLLLLLGCGGGSNPGEPAVTAVTAEQDAPAPRETPGQTPAPLPAAPRSPSAVMQPASGSARPTAAAEAADLSAALGALTQAVRKYSAEKQRVPQSLSEVVAAGYISGLPRPPAGQKFSIDPKRLEVVLVKQ